MDTFERTSPSHSQEKPRRQQKTRLLKLIAISVLSALLLLAAAGCTQSSAKPSSEQSLEEYTAYLAYQVPRLLEKLDVPGASIALIHQGEVAWAEGFGYADVSSGRLMTADSLCRAESISKSVTAWGVLQLVEQGRIDLDAPVQQYLGDWQFPETDYNTQEITVRGLLSGNAGLQLGTIGPDVEYALQAPLPSLEDHLTAEALVIRQPGSGFMYSNPGFDLLELVIENVSGEDFARYMAVEVLQPLGMDGASFTWQENQGRLVPNGYELDGSPVPPYIYASAASGGLLSNVRDLARFAAAGLEGDYFRDDGPLAASSIQSLHTAQVEIPGIFGLVADSYALGHFTESLPDGSQAIWHGGQGHGWMTHFHLLPQAGEGIVILTNSQRSWPLIATLLTDWADWLGMPRLQFSRIHQANQGLQALIFILALGILARGVHIIYQLMIGARKFIPLPQYRLPRRLAQSVLGVGILALLLWSASQPYLIIRAVFPGLSSQGSLVCLAFAVLLIVQALAPAGEELG